MHATARLQQQLLPQLPRPAPAEPAIQPLCTLHPTPPQHKTKQPSPQLLEVRPPGSPVPDAYHAIFPPLLTPAFWERSGNVPALVRLVQAYLARAGGDIVPRGYLQVGVGSAGVRWPW